jgi:hypothetical protein
MHISDVTKFPAACAQAAARAVQQVLDGELPAITLPANDPHRGQYINSITISGDGSVEVIVYAPGYGLRGQAPTCTVTATGDTVTSFHGLTTSGYRYHCDGASRRIDIWRDGDTEYGDLGSRRFVPAVAAWARSLGVEPSLSIIDTLQAAENELVEAKGGA